MKQTIILGAIIIGFFVPGTQAQTPQGPVPSSFFGMHLHDVKSAWPDVPIGALGKGSETVWPYIEPNPPSNGVHKYNWSILDAWVAMAQAHGVDFFWANTFVPRWAVSDTSTCTYTPVGQPPQSGCTGMVSNIDDWIDFTTALVTRYKGRIEFYELWNEPYIRKNFTGTVADMVSLTNHFHDVIREKDPGALIISPTHFGYDKSFMDSYWASGATKDVDVVSLHGEFGDISAEAILASGGGLVKALMAKYGLSNKPLWDTEAQGGNLTPDQIERFVAVDHILHWSTGISRMYWYEWDYDRPTYRLKDTPAATAYRQVYKWMVGATMSPCLISGADVYKATYSCDLVRGAVKTRAVWDAAGPSSYTVPTGYASYEDLSGNSQAIDGTTVAIGLKPILLKP